MQIKKIAKFVFAIFVCQMAGVVGSFFTNPSIPTWYATLQKPSFTPSGWFIGIAWITLFTLMGISLYLVWDKRLRDRRVNASLFTFGTQLLLNVLWSFFFFWLKSPLYGLIEIIILWIAIAFTIFKFYKISRNAGLLLIPYIIWVSIALTLNLSILILNP